MRDRRTKRFLPENHRGPSVSLLAPGEFPLAPNMMTVASSQTKQTMILEAARLIDPAGKAPTRTTSGSRRHSASGLDDSHDAGPDRLGQRRPGIHDGG